MNRYTHATVELTEDFTLNVTEYSVSHGINAEVVTLLNGMCVLHNNGKGAIFLRLKGSIFSVDEAVIELEYIIRNNVECHYR